MQSFKQFIVESDSGEIIPQFNGRGEEIGHIHRKLFKHKNANHVLDVKFLRHGANLDRHLISFSVNNSESAGDNTDVPMHVKMAMLNHVRKSVSNYIKKNKPKSIDFEPYDLEYDSQYKKENMYHKGLQSLGVKKFELSGPLTRAHLEHRLYEEVKKILDAN